MTGALNQRLRPLGHAILAYREIKVLYINEFMYALFFKHSYGSVAEWSKALVLGTSHFGGVGSNPTTITVLEGTSKTEFMVT